MELNNLTAISPIDGRYRSTTAPLSDYFSEYGLMKYRIAVEIEYFISLCGQKIEQLADFDETDFEALRELYEHFTVFNALKIKEIEKETNHDMKAVEYYIKEEFRVLDLDKYVEFIHFGLTSQDINNTSIPWLLKDAVAKHISPKLQEVVNRLKFLANEWNAFPMLAHTHGQPASPTRVGKEIMVFVERLEKQISLLQTIPFSAKFGGATGNFNAHTVAFPDIDWVVFGNNFVNDTLGLHRSQYTTQIEHYDNMAALFDNFKRINTILIDLDRDMWQYISMGYFKQKINKNETGSSAMPHKVNPIDFENSEGNLGFANSIYEYLSSKLPISRLQRDLTDSTVLRNIGVPIAHSMIAYNSLLKGLSKVEINQEALHHDLEENWAVVSEGIQTILRREAYPKPYEALKELTRNNEKITKDSIQAFINGLNVSDSIKDELKAITPFNYTGV